MYDNESEKYLFYNCSLYFWQIHWIEKITLKTNVFIKRANTRPSTFKLKLPVIVVQMKQLLSEASSLSCSFTSFYIKQSE